MRIDNQAMRRIFGKVEISTILKRMQGKRLKQTERNYLSRSIRPKLIAAKLLTEENVLKKIHKPDKSLEKTVIYNLSRYRYEMISLKKIKKQKSIGIEELIATIITMMPKPRFIEAIPILLLKNKINKFKLVEIASKQGIGNELGYLIETAIILAKRFNIEQDLNDLLDYLKYEKQKEIKYLGYEKDRIYIDFLIRTSPERIKKWNLLGRFFDEDFIKIGESYL